MKGEGQSMRIALEFPSKIFRLLSADECVLGWREFCSKGKKIVAALNQLCGEASLLAKNPELLNVTKHCVEGSDMLRSIRASGGQWPTTRRTGTSDWSIDEDLQ